jgi:uncharacterized protein RhaS with RHS repeats
VGTTYTYDSMDQMATRTDPLGGVDRYTYNLAGDLTAQQDRRGQVATLEYDGRAA